MTTEEKLTYCKVCVNRKMSTKLGMVCKLTGKKPSFDTWCPDFKADQKEVDRYEAREEKSHPSVLNGWGGPLKPKGANRFAVVGILLVAVSSAWFFMGLFSGKPAFYAIFLFFPGVVLLAMGLGIKHIVGERKA